MNSSKTLLVVEDDYSLRDAMKEALEGEGYVVLTANNGREALETLSQRQANISLVLLDLMMPVMNGREFLKEMKSREEFASLPVVVVSAVADRENLAGAHAFVKKPIDLDLLFPLVAKHGRCVPSAG